MKIKKSSTVKGASRFPRLLWLSLFCLGCVSCSESTQSHNLASEGLNPATWKTLENPHLGFSIQFPGKWKYHTEAMKTDKGNATVHIYEYWHIAFQYGVTVAEFPPGVADDSNPDLVLNYSIQSLIDEYGGYIANKERINVGGYDAIRAMISLPESYLKSARLNTIIVLRGNYIYRISTSGVGNHDYIEHFLDSFELTMISRAPPNAFK